MQVVVLLLQRFDVAPLAEEEVRDDRLARNQDTGQQGETCHLVAARGAATKKEEEGEKGSGGKEGEEKHV